MDWKRVVGKNIYNGEYRGHEIVARRIAHGWEAVVDGHLLRIRNPRLKTWLSARAVVEHVIRARIDGPGSATASVGHTGQGEASTDRPIRRAMPRSGKTIDSEHGRPQRTD